MTLEVKINREIREYTESMFFGLSMRQFFFSIFSCVVAVAVYFLLRPILGMETVSWLCILAAFPFALMGFVKYNGMTAERFIWAWIKSELLIPKKLTFRNTNLYYRILLEMRKRGKEKDKNTENNIQKRQRKIHHSKRRARHYSGADGL